MYESKFQRLLPRWHFVQRLLQHLLIALLIIALTLLLGTLGHYYFEDMSWHDAFFNAAYVFSGLSYLTPPNSLSGKLFLVVYSIYVQLIILALLGVLSAPVIHRVLHRLHLDSD